MKLVFPWLALATFTLGARPALPATSGHGPFTVNIYSHPWYTLNPEAATKPFVSMCTRLVDRLFRSPEDNLSIWVKPPWPLACGQPWVNALLALGNKDAREAMAANAAAQGFELPNAQSVFCSSTIPNYSAASYVKITSADGAVRVEGPLLDDNDLDRVLSQVEAER